MARQTLAGWSRNRPFALGGLPKVLRSGTGLIPARHRYPEADDRSSAGPDRLKCDTLNVRERRVQRPAGIPPPLQSSSSSPSCISGQTNSSPPGSIGSGSSSTGLRSRRGSSSGDGGSSRLSWLPREACPPRVSGLRCPAGIRLLFAISAQLLLWFC